MPKSPQGRQCCPLQPHLAQACLTYLFVHSTPLPGIPASSPLPEYSYASLQHLFSGLSHYPISVSLSYVHNGLYYSSLRSSGPA